MKPTNPQTEIEAATIARILAALPFDGVMTYAAASQAIGRDVTQQGCFVLMKARALAETETGSLYATVHRTGIQRLASHHVAGVGSDARRRIGRAAKRAFERLTAIKYNDLDPAARARIDAERSVLGAITAISATSAVKRVEAATTTGPVPAGKVFAAIS